MSLEPRELQRRLGLRQNKPSRELTGHQHSQWYDQYIPIHLGDAFISSVTNVQIGQIIPLNLISMVYVVDATLLVTYSFTGSPHTATLTISECSGSDTYALSAVATQELIQWDVSDWFSESLQELCSTGMKFYGKVDNVLATLRIHGCTLRLTHFKNDTFGGNENYCSKLLYLPSNVNKEYIDQLEDLSKDFRYLSGLEME